VNILDKCEKCKEQEAVRVCEISDYQGFWSKNMSLCLDCILMYDSQGYCLKILEKVKNE
jgi:hypothetical protein